MARFDARQQADIYPGAPPVPQVWGDLLSLVLGKDPLVPPTTTTLNDIPIDSIPAATTAVTNSLVITTTVVTTGTDGEPTTVVRTSTRMIVLPTTTNGNDPNGPTERTGSSTVPAPNHATPSPGSNRNGSSGTSTARGPFGVAGGKSTVVASKASLVASKGSSCVSSCDWQFGTTMSTRTGSTGLSPTGGSTDRPDSGDNSNSGAVIGGIVGAIIGAVFLMLAIYFLVRRARRRRAAANNMDDATGLLSDADPFRSMHPRGSRQSRMTIDTQQLQRSPSFGTLYGLRYNPDVAGGSVQLIGNTSPSAPLSSPMQWKPFTPSVPSGFGPESPICLHSPSEFESDTIEVCRHSVDNGPSADRPLGVSRSLPDADHRSSPSLSVAAAAENPFAAEEDAPERGGSENLDVKRTISHSSGSDYSDPN